MQRSSSGGATRRKKKEKGTWSSWRWFVRGLVCLFLRLRTAICFLVVCAGGGRGGRQYVQERARSPQRGHHGGGAFLFRAWASAHVYPSSLFLCSFPWRRFFLARAPGPFVGFLVHLGPSFIFGHLEAARAYGRDHPLSRLFFLCCRRSRGPRLTARSKTKRCLTRPPNVSRAHIQYNAESRKKKQKGSPLPSSAATAKE